MKRFIRQIVFSRLHRPVIIIDKNYRILYVAKEVYEKMPVAFIRRRISLFHDKLNDVIQLTSSDRYNLETYLKDPGEQTLQIFSLKHGVHLNVSPIFLHEFLIEFFLFDDYIQMYEEYMYHKGSVIRTYDSPPKSETKTLYGSGSVLSVSRIILDAADEFISAVSEETVWESFNSVLYRIFAFDTIDILLFNEKKYRLMFARNSITGSRFVLNEDELAFFKDIFTKSDTPMVLHENEILRYTRKKIRSRELLN
jgi:hypothetical protein